MKAWIAGILGAVVGAAVALAFAGRYQITESQAIGPYGISESVVRRFDRWTGEMWEARAAWQFGNKSDPQWRMIQAPARKADFDPDAYLAQTRAQPARRSGVTFLDEEPKALDFQPELEPEGPWTEFAPP